MWCDHQGTNRVCSGAERVKEFFVFLDDDATEDQIKSIAAEIFILSPLVVGVYRPAPGARIEDRVTHATPEATQ